MIFYLYTHTHILKSGYAVIAGPDLLSLYEKLRTTSIVHAIGEMPPFKYVFSQIVQQR